MIRTLASALATTTCLVALATPAAAQTREFIIPAGSLRVALDTFARQSGRQVIYRGDEVRSTRSPGVRGAHTAEEALDAILAGTGFRAQKDSSGAFAVAKVGNGQVADNASSREEDQNSDIVVTGTHVAGVAPSSPLIQFSRKSIQDSGYTSVGQFLQTVPQNFGGGQNPNVVGVGGQGINQGANNISQSSSANLRGIGSNSTLTLIDGRRLAFDGQNENIDLSVIPMVAVKRVDIMTDGASAVYGSDAVAGVVNVILRKDFQGAETNATVGVPTRGDGISQQYSQIVGTRFTNGNFVLSGEYSLDDPLLASDRSFSRGALSPFYLLPRAETESLFGATNYSASSSLNLRLEGVYSHKDTDSKSNVNGTTTDSRGAVDAYGLNGGADFSFAGNGNLSLDVGASGNRQILNSASSTAAGSQSRVRLGYNSKIRTAEIGLRLPTISIPTGDLHLAAGAGYRRESLDVQSSTPGTYARNVYYAYGELSAPLVPRDAKRIGLVGLQVDASVRYERYDQIGGTTNSKFGVSYTPIEGLAIKGSWGTSFRAPSLAELHQSYDFGLFPGFIFGPPVPTNSTILLVDGPNLNLRPETAKNWTVSAELKPPKLAGFSASISYYSIDYSNRIASAITSPLVAFSDPIYAPFVVVNPSTSLLASYLSRGPLTNNSGAPYDASTVYGIIIDGTANVSEQKIHGIDASAAYTWTARSGTWTVAANGSWLNFSQKLLPGTPSQIVDGTIFNPPHFKLRGSIGWDSGPWSVNLFVNHVSAETNNVVVPVARVGAFTTIDAQVGYRFASPAGLLKGLGLRLSVQNLLDSAPPRIAAGSTLPAGVGFDAANASAFGARILFSLTKAW